ncbi:unnamed protein product [Lupinus luteus]|uniref:Uncharacterized protein n=1 Tax=Lupinus luteus TaxID=3873 RepID=A0AAV1XPM1_LUPLU
MENTTLSRMSILLLLLMSIFFMSLHARNTLHGHQFNHKHVDSQHIFHKFGFDLSKHIHNGDALVPQNTDTLAPGGPDPHHNHALSPTHSYLND